MFVISPDSVTSAQCLAEIEDAVASEQADRAGGLPGRAWELGTAAIADAEWVFLRDTDDMVAGIERLAEALDTDLQWRDQHTRLAGHVLASRAKTTDVCVVRYTTLGD